MTRSSASTPGAQAARIESAAGAAGRFTVAGELDFASVPAVYAESQRLFEGCPDLVLDFAGVTRANSAALALLLEWFGQSRRAGRPLTFENVPQGLINLAHISELEDILPLRARAAAAPGR